MTLLGIISSSKSQAWTPAQFTNLKAWWDASDTSTITASSNAVSQWNDKSGNGYNITQATAAYQPTSGLSTQNGLNVVTFDGGDGLFNTTKANWVFLHDGTKVLIGAVFKPGTASDPNTLYAWMTTNASGGADGCFVWWDDRSGVSRNDRLLIQTGNTATGGTPVFNTGADNQMPANAYDYATYIMDATNGTNTARSEIKTDVSTTQNNNDNYACSSNNPDRNFCLGGQATSTTNTVPESYSLLGGIAEVVIAAGTTDVTTANRDKLATYLKNKWGV